MHEFAEDPPIEVRVGEHLEQSGDTLAVAESFTGGLVAALVTEVPGSSAYFDRGLVTYTYDAKMDELAVQQEVLEEVGAVNEIVAEQMACGVRDVAGTRWGVATTGIAGPDAPESGGEVGTAYVAVARSADDEEDCAVTSAQRHLDGTRSQIKERGARLALRELYDCFET